MAISTGNSEPEPVLVLALGNLLLSDDGVGLRMLEILAAEDGFAGVEYLDGGTQGIALTGFIAGRRALLVLDAVGLGSPPGTVHVLRGTDIAKLRARRAASAHEGNGLSLIETAQILGDCPGVLAVVGVEPKEVRTGIGLSPEVESGLKAALAEARKLIGEFSTNSAEEQLNLCA